MDSSRWRILGTRHGGFLAMWQTCTSGRLAVFPFTSLVMVLLHLSFLGSPNHSFKWKAKKEIGKKRNIVEGRG